jgi:signal peptidase II
MKDESWLALAAVGGVPPAGSPGAAPGAPVNNRPKPFLERLLAYRLLLVLAAAVLALDQASKFWIAARLPFGTYGPPAALTVAPGFFYLVHVGNTGAAWSIFPGRSAVLAVLAGATLVAIGIWRETLGLRQRSIQAAFGLLCGGIAGNLLDRLVHGHVTDFVDLHFGSYVYPTFNVADSGICVGTLLYVILALRHPPRGS